MIAYVAFALLLGISIVPPPDSLVLPIRADTLTDTELTMFPPEGAQLPLCYQVDWGDGETLDWTQPSRTDYTRYHRYRRHGDFEVRVRARDPEGRVSEWSKPLVVHVTDPVLKWVFPTFEPIVASPTLDDNGNVYVGDEDGWFYSIDVKGQLRWSYQAKDAIYAAAAIFRDNVYVPSMDSNLYCFDTQGKLRWKTFLGDELYTAPAVDPKGNLYIGGDAGTLYALSNRGQVRWRYKTGDEISSSPTIGVNGLIYITCDSVYCLDSRGRRRWTFGTPNGDYFFAGAVPDLAGNVYVGNEDGRIYCIGPDGRQRWCAPVPDEDEIKTEVVIAPGDTLYVGSDGYYLFRKAPGDVARLVYEVDDYLISTPAISSNRTLYFLPDDGFVYAVSATGRRVWRYEVAMEEKDLYYTSSPVIGPDGTVYVGSWDGGLYAFEGDGPPARSLWPQYRHDAQHTGRLTRLPKR